MPDALQDQFDVLAAQVASLLEDRITTNALLRDISEALHLSQPKPYLTWVEVDGKKRPRFDRERFFADYSVANGSEADSPDRPPAD